MNVVSLWLRVKILQEEMGGKVALRQRLAFVGFMGIMLTHSVSCSYPQERFRQLKRDFQQEVARKAAEPRSPEEACQRRGGVLNNEQCYTPSLTGLDERNCRLRGGLYLDAQCLLAPQEKKPLKQ